MNILIPMAGLGSRFDKAGYSFPKPLIEVRGKPMIQVVIENLGMAGVANHIFLVAKAHIEKYHIDEMLNLLVHNCTIVVVDELTEGAACTTLLAKKYIDNDENLLVVNSDQLVEWDSQEFYKEAFEYDGCIATFKATHPKWSFAKTDAWGFVDKVAEKRPISDNATVGIYAWKRGSDYVKSAEQMVNKNIRTNGEFYVCPVYNEGIANGLVFTTHEVDAMWGLGTPEDLNTYLRHNQ
jgi:NDP-sugar pyrophosphorylase family protein